MYAVFFHAHQKIDRLAYWQLRQLDGGAARGGFPTIGQILHFEGRNGPDATKLKGRPGSLQPWHFIDPFDADDNLLDEQIGAHFDSLVAALAKTDAVRAAFEAAWLAHALVDGLTPAHHYPYERELEALRGSSRHDRRGLLGRAFVRGETRLQSIRRSYSLLGPKGLLMTHTLFEAGAYTIMLPLRLSRRAKPSADELAEFKTVGLVEFFRRYAKEIASLSMYERFYGAGWTPKLARDVRRQLAPRMVKIVTLAWYGALEEAGHRPNGEKA